MTTELLIPAKRSPWVSRGFLWWVRKMFRKQFFAIRSAADTQGVLESLESHRGPAIVVMNHSSWWDPLIGLTLMQLLAPSRLVLGPMEAAQLKKFQVFRKLGVFGIDPDSPESLDPMVRYVRGEFEREPRTVFVVTPQGAFADVRSPIRLRPGTATLAARLSETHPDLPVVCIAVEMGFWIDQRPEIFVRFERCRSEHTSTTGWLRAMTRTMEDNAAALAAAVTARDPAAFEILLGGEAAKINPLYDLWQRVRGKSTRIEATARTPARRAQAATSTQATRETA